MQCNVLSPLRRGGLNTYFIDQITCCVQVIFAQPRNIPLYCAQLLEGRLQERLVQEQAERREEQEVEVAR